MAEVRRLLRGESDCLRIGFVASAVHEYLGPPLAALRLTYPKLKVKMLDQTPAEMIVALQRGEIDLALIGIGAELLARDFYIRKLASVPSIVSLPANHRLAGERQISLSELKDETFIRGSEDVIPGYTDKITQFCRKFGRFRPRLVTISGANSLAEGLTISANEDAISLQPAFISHLKIPNVVMVPIADSGVSWDLFIAWQRGKAAGPLRVLLDTVFLKGEDRDFV